MIYVALQNLYQPTPVPYAQRLFKYIPPSKPISRSSSQTDEEEEQAPRAIRLRRARGGRWFVDRRLPTSQTTSMTRDASHVVSFRRRLHEGESDDDNESDEERTWRLAERWKFDKDDPPAVGPEGLDEQDRVLVDDFDPKFLRHSITLLHDQDQHTLTTDNSLTVTAADGRMQTIIPY
jgi:enhancer of polycomb-like protein